MILRYNCLIPHVYMMAAMHCKDCYDYICAFSNCWLREFVRISFFLRVLLLLNAQGNWGVRMFALLA